MRGPRSMVVSACYCCGTSETVYHASSIAVSTRVHLRLQLERFANMTRLPVPLKQRILRYYERSEADDAARASRCVSRHGLDWSVYST